MRYFLVKSIYKECDECPHEFEVELYENGDVFVDGMLAEFADDESGWTITTIHGERQCDSTLIVHREELEDDGPCCPDPGCGGHPCTFPGYADNH